MCSTAEDVRAKLVAARAIDEAHATETEPLIKAPAYGSAKAAMAPPGALDAPDDACCAQGFSTGLCDCCTGPQAFQICLLSWLMPCFAHGLIANHASDGASGQQGPCMLYTFGWACLSAILKTPAVFTTALGTLSRGKLRAKYGLHQDGCADCCTHMWCHPCAMAQEIRHIRDARAAEVVPAPTGDCIDAAPTPAKMQLVSWTKVEAADKVASLTAAYI